MTQWMYSLPLWWGKVMAIILFAGIAVWVCSIPIHYIFSGAPDKKRWRDVRIWAVALMIFQIVIYLKF